MLRIIPNAISPFLIERTIKQMEYYMKSMDLYDNPFESKLQLPKILHEEYPFSEVLAYVNSETTVALMEQLFDVKLLREVDDYHTAFFVYRPGDKLQYHLDCAMHERKRKIITANLYLTECEGGEFVFRSKIVKPKPGMLIAFTNDDEAFHGVYPVRDGYRMLVTTGYSGPKLSNMTRSNQRAKFVPWPDEEWTEQQWEQAKERAE